MRRGIGRAVVQRHMSLDQRIVDALGARGMLAADGATTRFGKPAVRKALPGHEPERLMEATEPQRNFVSCAFGTPWPGTNACAEWIEEAYARLGYGVVSGHAYELCRNYCSRTDLTLLKVGMIVGVEHHPYDANGLTYGHVGLYIGDELVRDCADNGLRTVPLEAWLSVYGVMDDPRWGWLGGMALDQARRTW